MVYLINFVEIKVNISLRLRAVHQVIERRSLRVCKHIEETGHLVNMVTTCLLFLFTLPK